MKSKKPAVAKQSANKGRSSVKTKTPAKKGARDLNPAAAYSTSSRGRDTDPAKPVRPRRG